MYDLLTIDFLTLLTFLPLLGAVIVFLMPRGRENVRRAGRRWGSAWWCW